MLSLSAMLAGGAMGVADGVGGWQESGINPAGACHRIVAVAADSASNCDHFASHVDDH